MARRSLCAGSSRTARGAPTSYGPSWPSPSASRPQRRRASRALPFLRASAGHFPNDLTPSPSPLRWRGEQGRAPFLGQTGDSAEAPFLSPRPRRFTCPFPLPRHRCMRHNRTVAPGHPAQGSWGRSDCQSDLRGATASLHPQWDTAPQVPPPHPSSLQLIHQLVDPAVGGVDLMRSSRPGRSGRPPRSSARVMRTNAATRLRRVLGAFRSLTGSFRWRMPCPGSALPRGTYVRWAKT